MPPSFKPCLINNPSDDPGLLVSFSFQNRAIVFDLGDIYNLSSRDILKITHIFVSHTHMDHFAGFDRLLRIMLGREKTIYIYGPEGFLANIEGKLSGYTWNLVQNFSSQLNIHATEISENTIISQEYSCQNGFRAVGKPVIHLSDHHEIHQESSFTVNAMILDHGIPSIGFALQERLRVNIRKDILDELGLIPGDWIDHLKRAIFEEKPHDLIIEVPHEKNGINTLKKYKFSDLADRLTLITEGQKIAYVADAAYTPANIEKIINLARNADHLFIEAAFLETDNGHASEKRHLTARQAGELAGLAGARRFTLFHFSPRYQNAEDLFYDEAEKAYHQNERRD